MFVHSRRNVVYHQNIQNIHHPVSALFHQSAELYQKTTRLSWWASKEKCPWSHLNQSFLQAGFSLIWSSAFLHMLIVFPWSATVTPQMFIQARLETDRVNLRSGLHSLHTVSLNLQWFMTGDSGDLQLYVLIVLCKGVVLVSQRI